MTDFKVRLTFVGVLAIEWPRLPGECQSQAGPVTQNATTYGGLPTIGQMGNSVWPCGHFGATRKARAAGAALLPGSAMQGCRSTGRADAYPEWIPRIIDQQR